MTDQTRGAEKGRLSPAKISAFLGKYSIFVILVLAVVISSFLSPNFLTVANITNVLRQNSVVSILAFGETMLIIAGLIDLSSGAVLAVSGIISIFVFKATGSLPLSFVTGLGIGVMFNLLSGLMVSVWKTPPFIATLAVTTISRGTVLLITAGQSVYQIGNFVVFGQGSLPNENSPFPLHIPIPIIFMLLMLLITWYVLNQTRLGRAFYATGGNEEAANASGIKVAQTKFICYIVNGILVGLAGVLFMSRVNAGIPNAGVNYEFEALTAAIIGGTSFSGGVGTALGTLAGALIVGILNNIMNLLGVNPYVQQIIKGSIIALAVIMDIWAKNRRSKPKPLSESA
ncbi:MAG: ABC transporter permease [Spirochaetaceae bacterium]|jgi:inositol transport system permease protein|nr:ABC transporter permease [Spirochaetaceae bacterium]